MIADLKPHPAMKDSGVEWLDMIPEHWEIRRMKTLLRERSEKGFPDKPLLAATQTKGVVRKEQYENRTVLALKDLHLLKLVRVGDFVISLRSFQGGIEYAREQGIISPAYTILYPVERDNHAYLTHVFKSEPYIENLSLFVTGIRQGQNIDYEKLSRSPFPYPPLPEQAAIVRFLDHADRRIRRYIRTKQKLITLLKEQKQAIIHRAVTRGLDPNVRLKPSGVEWLGDVPEHWEVRRLKSKLRPVDRRSSSGTETLLSLRRDFGVVVYAEHFSRPPQGVTLVGYKLVEAGQLVVNRLQANNGLLFCSRLSGVVSPDYSVFAERSPVDMEYLGNLLRTVTYKTHFRRESTGLGTGSAGFLRLYDDKLLETSVSLPPLEEQSTLLVSLSEITASLCRAIGRQHVGIALLREYRTRLIADVVTGKLDVREEAARLPEVDPLAGEFDALTTQAAETGMMELGDATETPEELAMENEVTI